MNKYKDKEDILKKDCGFKQHRLHLNMQLSAISSDKRQSKKGFFFIWLVSDAKNQSGYTIKFVWEFMSQKVVITTSDEMKFSSPTEKSSKVF